MNTGALLIDAALGLDRPATTALPGSTAKRGADDKPSSPELVDIVRSQLRMEVNSHLNARFRLPRPGCVQLVAFAWTSSRAAQLSARAGSFDPNHYNYRSLRNAPARANSLCARLS
jgi:hypothetical protein